MSHNYFIHLSTDAHLGCFHILVIVKTAAINIGVLMFFQISVLGSSKHIPRSGVTGSKGRIVFNFLKEILSFITAWMDPESIMLSEISQSEKDKYHVISLICGN